MVPRGLEPRTLWLLAVRSNQLSYETLTSYLKTCSDGHFRHGRRPCEDHVGWKYLSPAYMHIRCSIVVSISACHAEDPGSIAGGGAFPALRRKAAVFLGTTQLDRSGHREHSNGHMV